MSTTTHSPAEVLRQLLVGGAMGTLGGAGGAWPVFVGHRPAAPDTLLCCYDTPGYTQGRIQRTGETIHTPGWQVWVRAADHRTGWQKAAAISQFLDAVRNAHVTIGGVDYTVRSTTKTGNILAIGREHEKGLDSGKRYNEFTINGIIHFEEQ